MSDQIVRGPETGAEALLLGLKESGIDYLFANAGTDFPPIIEAYAELPAAWVPQPITVPHETASLAMAHGHYLVTGRTQAVMVHVNVGLANTVMGVINAASDNIPVLVMSGRTPITETGRPGHRTTSIHYGQEMFDQTSLVRDLVKYTYEMRFPEQGGELVGRALAVAASAPEGPVYLSLPREPLAERLPSDAQLKGSTARPRATPAAPDPASIATLANWLSVARAPMIVCQRGDPSGKLGGVLAAFVARHGIGVSSPFVIRSVIASDHPNFLGYRPDAGFADADLVLVLDSATPWIAAQQALSPETRVVHIGPDPHFTRMPVRGYRTDLAIQADPAMALTALDEAMGSPASDVDSRNRALARSAAVRQAKLAEMAKAAAASDPMGGEWLSRCVGAILGEDGAVFSDLGIQPGFMEIEGANRVFVGPHSGGLGWAMNAALGAQLANRDRLVVASMGDGSYMFANPVAAHQIAEALTLPILTIIKNNNMWNAVRRSVVASYPDGAAVRANAMPLTSLEPLPDFVQIAKASRAYAERVERAADLPKALSRALDVIRTERRQALLDVRVAISDDH